LNSNKNSIKNDINYYLNYLSPTQKKAPICNSKSSISYEFSQKYPTESKDKGEGIVFKSLLSRQEKTNSDLNDMDEFTKEFHLSNNKNNNSLFQQKLSNVETKLLSEKSFFK
jgi:hypothetical protein